MTDRLVLAYHAISDEWESSLAISRAALREQVGHLLDRGYRPTRFLDAVTSGSPDPVFAVTFDDAYRSVYERARPILDELGVPATVFVPTSFPGEETPMGWPGVDDWHGTEHEDELLCMTWDQIAELQKYGWEVGSHTRTHARLPRLEDESLRHELRVSKETCERALGVPCRTIAYPFGDVDSRVSAAAAAAGYEAGAGMPGRYRVIQPLEWPRVGIYPADDMRRFRIKIDPRIRRLRATRLWKW